MRNLCFFFSLWKLFVIGYGFFKWGVGSYWSVINVMVIICDLNGYGWFFCKFIYKFYFVYIIGFFFCENFWLDLNFGDLDEIMEKWLVWSLCYRFELIEMRSNCYGKYFGGILVFCLL